MSHDVTWTAPQPFWTDPAGAVQPHGALARPQILRFTHDEFINELLATLERDPAALRAYAATDETWRGPGPATSADPQRWLQREPAKLVGVNRLVLRRRRAAVVAPAAPAPAPSPPMPLKLYQPAHLRHYLVGGSLVCRTPGLPDRLIDPARHKVAFVLRRLLPNAPVPAGQPLPDPGQTSLWDEYAFVPKGKAGLWQFVARAADEAAAAKLPPAEERLALFPALYTQDDARQRRLYIGNVPVGRREAYQCAPTDAPTPPASAGDAPDFGDPRIVQFHTQVLGPWKALVNRVMGNGLATDLIDDEDALKRARPPWVF